LNSKKIRGRLGLHYLHNLGIGGYEIAQFVEGLVVGAAEAETCHLMLPNCLGLYIDAMELSIMTKSDPISCSAYL
jgi:hypothetical protein